eukprot:TRINITY_DN9077_c0_g1_i1.p1 TRINITY_DN9077_c0_g1~~TRINITY_DN9077_c0_g1_i1.p1  ORF type:complete len:218 (-),score=89.49 TRINITY_DN9077_c0_g1_i1:70-723(-)
MSEDLFAGFETPQEENNSAAGSPIALGFGDSSPMMNEGSNDGNFFEAANDDEEEEIQENDIVETTSMSPTLDNNTDGFLTDVGSPNMGMMGGDAFQPESGPLRTWEKEHNAKMTEQRAQEREELDGIASEATKYRQQQEQLRKEHVEKSKKMNREAEAELTERLQNTEEGHSWERVAEYCNFTHKNAIVTKDTGRIKTVILKAKEDEAKSASASSSA